MVWETSASFDCIDGVNLHLKEKKGKRKVSFISGTSHEVTAQYNPLLSKLVENSLYRDLAWLLLTCAIYSCISQSCPLTIRKK